VRIDRDTPLGLVGLGYMGTGIAENLLKKGFSLTVHERSEKVRRWASGRRGVRLTPSLRELASCSRVILLVVTDNKALDEVLYSPEGVVGRNNSIHRPFLLSGLVKDSRLVKARRGVPHDQVDAEGDGGMAYVQSGPDRRESVPTSAVDRAATPDTTPQAACRRSAVLDSRLPVGSPMARVPSRRAARDRARLASPGVDSLLALAGPTTTGRRAAPHRG
jgi:hypothetical protein